MSGNSNRKETYASAQNSGQKEKVDKQAGDSKESLRRPTIAHPELPGSMKFMLADDKGEDRDLRIIRVSFLAHNQQEVEYCIVDHSGLKRWLNTFEYDEYKESFRRQKVGLAAEQIRNGFIKKLASRCVIFSKLADAKELDKQMSLKAPAAVARMMSMTQSEFTTLFKSSDAVLEYWKGISLSDAQDIDAYAEKFEHEWSKTLRGLINEKEERAAKKAAKLQLKEESQVGEEDMKPPPARKANEKAKVGFKDAKVSERKPALKPGRGNGGLNAAPLSTGESWFESLDSGQDLPPKEEKSTTASVVKPTNSGAQVSTADATTSGNTGKPVDGHT